jgi:hypothetical protein
MGNKNADKILIKETEQQYNFGSQRYGKIMLNYTLNKEGVHSSTRLEQIANMNCVSFPLCCRYIDYISAMVELLLKELYGIVWDFKGRDYCAYQEGLRKNNNIARFLRLPPDYIFKILLRNTST